MQPLRWPFRWKAYQAALDSLEALVARFEGLNDAEQDGLLQRFEYSFELAWKVAQDYLIDTGYTGLKGPRNILKQMAADSFLEPFLWEEMLEARNSLSHAYDAESSRIHLAAIRERYLPALREFDGRLKSLVP